MKPLILAVAALLLTAPTVGSAAAAPVPSSALPTRAQLDAILPGEVSFGYQQTRSSVTAPGPPCQATTRFAGTQRLRSFSASNTHGDLLSSGTIRVAKARNITVARKVVKQYRTWTRNCAAYSPGAFTYRVKEIPLREGSERLAFRTIRDGSREDGSLTVTRTFVFRQGKHLIVVENERGDQRLTPKQERALLRLALDSAT